MPSVIIMDRKTVASVLDIRRVIEEVRDVYKLKAEGKTAVWPIVEWVFDDDGNNMDIRSGCVKGKQLHGMKMVNEFHTNAAKGLPILTGMLMLFDSNTGLPLGIMDASYLTGMRTGSAGAIGAWALARKDASDLLVLGAGHQAPYQIAASICMMPNIKTIRIADPMSAENERAFVSGIAARLRDELSVDASGVDIQPAGELSKAVAASDVIITITPSRAPVIKKEWVKPGTHFSCIGADMTGKEEIDPEIFRGASVFCDDVKQCVHVGECEIPIKQGAISEGDIKGEIGEVLAGRIKGRTYDEEITIFDATGLAMLDLVTAKAAIDGAAEKGLGLRMEL